MNLHGLHKDVLFSGNRMKFMQANCTFVLCACIYHIAGNFHGVLIFVIFMVDLAVMKINAYGDIMRVHDDGHGQRHCGSTNNNFQC